PRLAALLQHRWGGGPHRAPPHGAAGAGPSDREHPPAGGLSMRTQRLIGIAGLALTLLAATATAQTFEGGLAIARDHAPRIRVGTASVSRAEQAVREARAALSPTLRLGASFTRNSEAQQIVFPIPGSSRSQSIKLGSANVLDVRTDAQYTLTSGG